MEQENMAYRVKEIFYTLQGEGAQAGRPAVFCRFSGCNLWSGRPEDRATAKCRFCDTDFVGADAGFFATAEELAQTIAATFPVLAPQATAAPSPTSCSRRRTGLAASPATYRSPARPRVRAWRGEQRHAAPARGAGLDHGQPQGFQPAGHDFRPRAETCLAAARVFARGFRGFGFPAFPAPAMRRPAQQGQHPRVHRLLSPASPLEPRFADPQVGWCEVEGLPPPPSLPLPPQRLSDAGFSLMPHAGTGRTEKAGKLSFPGFFKNHFLRKKGATIF